MTGGSWRESASQRAQDDLDGLLGAALPFAEKMLDKHGEFFPYAVVLGADGQPRMVAGHPGGERPASADVLAVLVDGLRAQRDEIRAAARVELEHREGHALVALQPYRKKRLRRGVEYADMLGSDGTPQVWTG
jgi:hypothetical protein